MCILITLKMYMKIKETLQIVNSLFILIYLNYDILIIDTFIPNISYISFIEVYQIKHYA